VTSQPSTVSSAVVAWIGTIMAKHTANVYELVLLQMNVIDYHHTRPSYAV